MVEAVRGSSFKLGAPVSCAALLCERYPFSEGKGNGAGRRLVMAVFLCSLGGKK